MTPGPNEKSASGPFGAFAKLFRRGGSSRPDQASAPLPEGGHPTSIGKYAITGELGRGGMGIVYAARDRDLDRLVALKFISAAAGTSGDDSRARFLREARAAASVNHPNIAQIYEIGEHRGEPFLAMELLEGESLADRLNDGPLTVKDTIPIGLGILDALSALHARGVIHRDLKPSNVFLTKHGVKLLDFGLARPIPQVDRTHVTNLTQTGMLVGTPRYIAPEQVTGEAIDERCDLFATGAILFEMLAGRPAFTGNNLIEILHATIHDQPPALTGSPAVAAVDRVIRHALSKRPKDRPQTADAMAEELRGVRAAAHDETPRLARTLMRIVVLPFRILRPDPETDFLAFSLPDAIATSLTEFHSLIVRSTSTASKFASDAPDLKALATAADVERVVMGTLLRSGEQLRVTVQLVEAPGGTLITSHAVTSSLGDLFRLQDELARRIVDALAIPLHGQPSTPDAPQDARAYSLYLQANALGGDIRRLSEAIKLYEECVEIDPTFAPAWAQLGRGYRVAGKFLEGQGDDSDQRAEAALRRALELNPRLSIAHKYYAGLEADSGRSLAALSRLLDEANRHANDPELFAGLVHACRYCGLYEQSIAAHMEAKRLDPKCTTSIHGTLMMNGQMEAALATGQFEELEPGEEVSRVIALGSLGRNDEALARLRAIKRDNQIPVFHVYADFIGAWLEKRPADMVRIRAKMAGLKVLDDPEAMFQEGFMLCDAGDPATGLDLIARGNAKGYFAPERLVQSPVFDRVRGTPEFRKVLDDAEAGRAQAFVVFRQRRGEQLLGRELVSAA
ncbi:MAG TPA: protein kinase [Candidatus Eisenbacteria bacterium]|nr:protein kinase [Candidatus Eisenbacteria bacterium]